MSTNDEISPCEKNQLIDVDASTQSINNETHESNESIPKVINDDEIYIASEL